MTDARRTGIVYRLRRYISDTRQDDPRVNATKVNVGAAVWNGRTRPAAAPAGSDWLNPTHLGHPSSLMPGDQ